MKKILIAFALLLLPFYSFAQTETLPIVVHTCDEAEIEFDHNQLFVNYEDELTVKKALASINTKVQKESDAVCKGAGHSKAFVFGLYDFEADIEDFRAEVIGKRKFRIHGQATYCCLKKKVKGAS